MHKLLPPNHSSVSLLLLTLALPGALATGCVNERKEIATYRTILDANTTPVTHTPGQPLTLEKALLLANQHNEELSIRGEDYLQALIAKNRAASTFFPTIALVPTYFHQDQTGGISRDDEDDTRPGGGFGGAASSDRRLDIPLNLRGSLTVSDLLNYRAAARTIDEQRALLLDAQSLLLLDVAQTYLQILRSERSVQVLESTLMIQNTRLRDMRNRVRAGFALNLDVAQTEAQASATRVSLINARNDIASARALLAFITAAPVADSPLLDPAEAAAPIQTLEQLQAGALQHRMDLVAAAAAVEAARANIRAAAGQYYPALSLNLNAFFSRESNPTESDWNALFTVNFPLFTGGRIRADVREAMSLARQARFSESILRRQVLRDVQIAYQDFLAADARMAELQVQVRAAQEALTQAERALIAGRATNLDWLVAQDRLLSAQLQLASARYDRKLFQLTLQRATGRLTMRQPQDPTTQPATRPTTLPTTLPSTRPATTPATRPT